MNQQLAPPIASFVKRARAYAAAAGLELSTVSRKIFNDGKTLGRLEEGCNIGVYTLESAHKTLAKLEAALDAERAA